MWKKKNTTHTSLVNGKNREIKGMKKVQLFQALLAFNEVCLIPLHYFIAMSTKLKGICLGATQIKQKNSNNSHSHSKNSSNATAQYVPKSNSNKTYKVNNLLKKHSTLKKSRKSNNKKLAGVLVQYCSFLLNIFLSLIPVLPAAPPLGCVLPRRVSTVTS